MLFIASAYARITSHCDDGCLVEGVLQVMIALFRASAPPRDRPGLSHTGHKATVGTEMTAVWKAIDLPYFIEDSQGENLADTCNLKESLIISLVFGQGEDFLLKLGDLMAEELNALKLLRSVENDQRMRKPVMEVKVIGKFDLITRGREDAFSQEHLSERAIFLRSKLNEAEAATKQIADRTGVARIDVSFRDETGPEEFGQRESIPAISFDFGRGDKEKAESVSKRDIETSELKAVDEPVPVESGFDDDLEVGFERLQQRDEKRKLVRELLLKVNREGIINDTKMSRPCAEINTGVEIHGRSPFDSLGFSYAGDYIVTRKAASIDYQMPDRT